MKRMLVVSLLQLFVLSVFSQIDISMDKMVYNSTNYLRIRVTNVATEDMVILQPETVGQTCVMFSYYQGGVSLNKGWEAALRTEEDRKMNRIRKNIRLKKGVTENFLVNLDDIFANVAEATKVKVHCIVVAIGTKGYSAHTEAEFSLSSSTPKKPIEQVTDPIGGGPVDSDKRPIN